MGFDDAIESKDFYDPEKCDRCGSMEIYLIHCEALDDLGQYKERLYECTECYWQTTKTIKKW